MGWRMTERIEHQSYSGPGSVPYHEMLSARAAELVDLLEHTAPQAGTVPDWSEPPPAPSPYSSPAPVPERDDRIRDDRLTAMIGGGRVNGPARSGFLRAPWKAHWKALTAIAAAAAVLGGVLAAVTSGSAAPAAWPSSVTAMQAQVAQACRNPDVAAEPSGGDFACGAGSRQVLWVFALLTSGGNPGYVDSATGRRGLEPITPAQGGNVAWSLNLHAPYDPARPVMSIEVAARAINNIAAGATLTGASGQPQVQGGLESKGPNCQRYTGSPALTSRPGYPARCAKPLTEAGRTALVTDVFRQWMPGAPAATAADAGVLFAHANDPGDPGVRKVLASLPGGM